MCDTESLIERPESAFKKPWRVFSLRIGKDHGLKEYEIELEKTQSRYWRLFKGLFPQRRPSQRRKYSYVDIRDLILILLLIVLPHVVAVAASYVYVVGGVDPTSAISAALHRTTASWLAYEICLPLMTIPAAFVDLVLLVGCVNWISRSCFFTCIASIIAMTPIWSPYVIEASIRQWKWNTECNGFDAEIYLNAVHYGQQGLSSAQFPESMGGQEWQLFNPNGANSVYQFQALDRDEYAIFNFVNNTYTTSINGTKDVGSFPIRQNPLALPEFGLSSEGGWTRACYAPAVDLMDSDGDVIIKTGLTAYTTCAYMKACARTSSGVDAVIVAIGRILIELQAGAQCCTQGRNS